MTTQQTRINIDNKVLFMTDWETFEFDYKYYEKVWSDEHNIIAKPIYFKWGISYWEIEYIDMEELALSMIEDKRDNNY